MRFHRTQPRQDETKQSWLAMTSSRAFGRPGAVSFVLPLAWLYWAVSRFRPPPQATGRERSPRPAAPLCELRAAEGFVGDPTGAKRREPVGRGEGVFGRGEPACSIAHSRFSARTIVTCPCPKTLKPRVARSSGRPKCRKPEHRRTRRLFPSRLCLCELRAAVSLHERASIRAAFRRLRHLGRALSPTKGGGLKRCIYGHFGGSGNREPIQTECIVIRIGLLSDVFEKLRDFEHVL